MEFTGERYVPSLDASEISYEHWHRYLYATDFVKGKTILDIACGEGYGSFVLAQSARRVVGIDISPEAINHAASTYLRKNLEFKVGSLENIPIAGHGVFDGIVSFESIEHIDAEQQKAFLREAKRLLKPGGFLLVSTPNRLVYSDHPGYKNEFHKKEFYVQEFVEFLSGFFEHVNIVGQRIYPVSYIWNILGEPSRLSEFRINFSSVGFRPTEEEKVPLYVLAFCSDRELDNLPQSVQVDLSGRILVARDQRIQSLETQLAEKVQDLQTLASQVAERDRSVQALTAQVEQQEQALQMLRAQAAERDRFVQALTAQVEQKEQALQTLKAQAAERAQNIQALNAQVAEKAQFIQTLLDQLAEHEQTTRLLVSQLNDKTQLIQLLSGQLNEREQTVQMLSAQTNAQEQALQTLNVQLNEKAATVQNLMAQVTERDQTVQMLMAQLQEKEQAIQAGLAQLSEKQQRIQALQNTLTNLEQQLATLTHQLADLQNYLGEREQALQYLNTQLLDIYSSTAWQLMRKLWQARLWLAPKGSRREKLGYFVVNLFRRRKDPAPQPAMPEGTQEETLQVNITPQPSAQGTLEAQPIEQHTPSAASFAQTGESDRIYKSFLKMARGEKAPEYVDLSDIDLSAAELPVKLLAFYLPQFHPIPENDEWWGKGFTEWTNVSRAAPQFNGHYQPRLPGELGFYDLRVAEVQRRQVELAKKYGIYGFCFYYYWFDGRRLLERPLDQFVGNPDIDFPFCLCWANENWTRRWDGMESEILIAQHHSVDTDYRFIHDIAPYLRHRNYIRIDGRPLLLVYRGDILENPIEMTKKWREYAIEAGIGNPYLVVAQVFGFKGDPATIGFDAAVEFPPNTIGVRNIREQINFSNPDFHGWVCDYRELMETMSSRKVGYPLFKTVMPGWDNTPRRADSATIFVNSSPDNYRQWLESAIRQTMKTHRPSRRFVFINAWNEWAESAYLEPDRKYGYAYLQATAEAVSAFPKEHRPGWKILFVSHDANLGGAQLLLLDVIRWLRTHTAIKCFVLCLQGGNMIEEFEKNAPTMTLDSIAALPEEERLAQLIDFCDGLPDLIYGNTVASGNAYPWLGRLGAPIVTHVHELNSSIQRYAAQAIEEVLRYSQGYIACSEAVKENLVSNHKAPAEKCFLAHSFVRPTEFAQETLDKKELRARLGLPQDAFLVIGGGIGMPYRKGADLFLETARRLRHRGLENFHFYWIGEFGAGETDPQFGPWETYLERMRAEGLDSMVTFLGVKQNPREYMLAGDVFFLSSREDPFPLMMLEAADCGLPVVCFAQSGGGPEFVRRDAGFVVPFADVQTAANKISFLMRQEEVRTQAGEKARARFQQEFTPDRIVPKILSFARTIADKKPAVTVIVPNYNHAPFLPQRLESIFGQTFRDFEVLLMDDASTDDSLQILARYKDRPEVKLLRNRRNGGTPFKQWLKAFEMARGDLIWIAESDDFCASNFLETLLPAFDDPAVRLAYCASQVVDEQNVVQGDYTQTDYLTSLSPTKWKSSYCVPAEQEINDGLGIKNTVLNISAVVFRRFEVDETFRSTLQTMHIGGDWYLILKAIRGGKIYYDPRLLNSHRRHATSIVGKILSQHDDTGLRNFFRDYAINLRYVVENYDLAPDFQPKLDAYLRELWHTLAPGRPEEELEVYFPLKEVQKPTSG